MSDCYVAFSLEDCDNGFGQVEGEWVGWASQRCRRGLAAGGRGGRWSSTEGAFRTSAEAGDERRERERGKVVDGRIVGLKCEPKPILGLFAWRMSLRRVAVAVVERKEQGVAGGLNRLAFEKVWLGQEEEMGCSTGQSPSARVQLTGDRS